MTQDSHNQQNLLVASHNGKAQVVKLDLGCGQAKPNGFIGLDRFKLPGVDIVADLNQSLPFRTDSIDSLMASQSLEHVQNLMGLIQEINRVCKHGSQVCIIAPYYYQALNLANPYHKQIFNEHSPRFWTNSSFTNVESKEWEHPHAQSWGLSESDQSIPEVDLRCLRMEFFYFPEYRYLLEEEKRVARKKYLDVCDQIMFHLLVIKKPTSEADMQELAKKVAYYEPPVVTIRRLQEKAEKFERENKQISGELENREMELSQIRATLEERNKELGEMRNALKLRDSEMTQIRAAMSDQEAAFTDIKRTLESRDAELRRMQIALEIRDCEIRQLRVALENRGAELSQVWNALAKRDEEMGRVRSSLEIREKELSRANEAMEGHIREFTRMKETLDLRDSELSHVRGISENREKELSQTRMELEGRAGELERIRTAMENQEAELSQMKTTLAVRDSEVVQLRTREQAMDSFSQKIGYKGKVISQELDAFRHRRATRWLNRLSKANAWDEIDPAFQQLKDDTLIFNQSLKGHRLVPSVNLQRVPFLHYPLDLRRPHLKGILLAPTMDFPLSLGILGIEIVSPESTIVVQTSLLAAEVREEIPARFEFPPIPNTDQGRFWLRVFTREIDGSLRVFEWQKYGVWGIGNLQRKAFCAFLF